MAKFDPSKTPGQIGIAPPAHAPQESTTPGSERATSEQIRQARMNEQPESVYNPRPMSDEQAAAFLGKSVDEIVALRQRAAAPKPLQTPVKLLGPDGQPVTSMAVDEPADPATPPPPVVIKPAMTFRRAGQPRPSIDVAATTIKIAAEVPLVVKPVDVPSSEADPQPVVASSAQDAAQASAATLSDIAQQLHPRHDGSIPLDEPYRPAASDTDSPSRGMPTAVLPKDKTITGGFGDVGEAQYYGLNGLEVLALITAQLDALKSRIQNDLRFSIAAVYPRLNARVVIEIDCFAQDTGFQIERKLVPAHTRTPIDIARRHADECCFCIIEEHVEMTEDGESVTPPNQVRLELGLDVPRKHSVRLPNQQTMMVDIS